MGELESFEDEMQNDISELEETREIRERLQGEYNEVDQKLDAIIDNLNDLKGDAADRVRQELLDEREKKGREIQEKEKTIETKEQDLDQKLKQIEESITERKDAMSKVEDLAKTADIDASDAINDINDEIQRLEEDRQKALESLGNL